MKVKLLTARATATGSENRGDVLDVDADEGQRMIEAGQAELVRAAKPEKAVKRKKTEKAIK